MGYGSRCEVACGALKLIMLTDSGQTTGAEDACTLGSANGLEIGRFARLAQAAHLLSLVIKDVAEGSSDSSQLRRTIFALVHVSRIEARLRKLELCTQMTTCFRYGRVESKRNLLLKHMD